MPLWGVNDDKTSTGTVAIAANGLVTGSSTLFETEAKVGDYIIADDKKHRIISITSNTVAHVGDAGVLGGTIGAVSDGAYALQEAPIFVSTSHVADDANNVFGVDAAEVAATAGVAHTGWVKRTAGSGNKSGRVFHEVLVAGGITSDAADDTEFPDS